jgi:hypothetical protein
MKAVTFRRLEAASFTHSAIYVSLLICAFVLGSPQPATFILGMAHGLMWIGMSLVCLAAARARIIPLWLAVNVVVAGVRDRAAPQDTSRTYPDRGSVVTVEGK